MSNDIKAILSILNDCKFNVYVLPDDMLVFQQCNYLQLMKGFSNYVVNSMNIYPTDSLVEIFFFNKN